MTKIDANPGFWMPFGMIWLATLDSKTNTGQPQVNWSFNWAFKGKVEPPKTCIGCLSFWLHA